MKQKEMMERIMAGDAMMPGKYVLLNKEVIAYTVKKGPNIGQRATFNKLSHAIQNPKHGIVFVQVDARKIPDFDFEKYVSPFKPGQEVVACITEGLTVNMGIKTVAGEIHAIEP